MRSLGLDIGDKRIGVALSDPGGILASPHTIIHRHNETADIEAIVDLVVQHEVKQVIVGLPLSMNGSASTQTKKVEEFTQVLAERVAVPISFRDERLTTVAARRLVRAGRAKGNEKYRHDAVAAALILQAYLDETLNQ